MRCFNAYVCLWCLVLGWFLVFYSCSGLFSDLEGEVAASTSESLDPRWLVMVVVWGAATVNLYDCIFFLSIEVLLELSLGSS